MEDATSLPRLTSAEIDQALTPNSGSSPEQRAEVIERLDGINERLDAINASQHRLETLLQQIVNLLSQGKG